MRHYQSPTRYYLQYLLIPIRLLLFLPLFACLIILNLLAQTILAVIGLIATGVLVGSGWLIDTYIWHGFSKSPIAALLAVLLIYPTYNGVGYCIGKIIEQFAWMPGLKEFSASLSEKIGNWWDRAVTFVFEAKYKQSPLDIYGPDFPEPTFAEFNLDKEEYYAYNRRFSLEGFEFSIAVF